jgi:UDP-glucuronate 4-epimerase
VKILITGTAGFIGFHLAKSLLREGHNVCGFDGLTDYYDVDLKKKRHAILEQNEKFKAEIGMLEDQKRLMNIGLKFKPDIIIHLAAQAGVRYSLENPKAYIESNITGTFHIMDLARSLDIKHLMMASTSSVYGANTQMPFCETDMTDTPLTLYAATKKANENMAHSYAHLWNIPTTMLRFFTVYGPWGRPDLALFKFVKAIKANEPIDIYNHGNMHRDFTYVDDLIMAIQRLIDVSPELPEKRVQLIKGDCLSSAAPFRTINIGTGTKVKLLDFIDAIEDELGRKANKNFMDMQMGDVPATWANTHLLHALTGARPATQIKTGIKHFVNWYNEYYH